ncbi:MULTISPECIES: ParB N-terminal domain-containing protein [Leptospira]|uniref:Chromosome partitioning protein ParB n=2 Tax=Leptospira interrogans TaxID=173 RepID=A0AAP9WQC3_LEPIR|nr:MULTISPECIES: ParB N-terminal domain-containing protein [Leptospira]KAA1292878.1 chromosome partitioning protein ParB [Leptospira interrogans serovar Geyaweera]EMN93022.1 ParB-like protein [Leptospira interrogans serovar Medanensis str. UT053]KAA1292967.1 chromosome partitioning protein ParB [Leptospira interrogans serovar Geyaweera]MCL8311350.1 ParB N-terminal domain-containing protein [Leptospira interrogans]QOI53190.1 chromosome partitioning protein ParB [Leptospira interrogans serovar B
MEETLLKFNPTKLTLEDPNKLILDDSEDTPFKTLEGEAYEELKNSIKRNGILHPVYCQKDYRIISGNNRVLIARELGILVPVIRFRLAIDKDAYQEILYHTNIPGRQVTPADRRKIVFSKFKNELGKRGALKTIQCLTGIGMSTLKQYSVDFQNQKEFENFGLDKQKRNKGLKLFEQYQEFKKQENEIRAERAKIERKLTAIAPLKYWTSGKFEKDMS